MKPNEEIIDHIADNYTYYKIIKDESPYKWNGEYLGTLINDNILTDIKDPITSLRYWKINFFGHETFCSVRKVKNASICIYDEAMEIFNLPKMGSHYIIYKNDMYHIQKARTNGNTIHSELLLTNLDPKQLSKENINKIRKLYIVRDILGSSHTYINDIAYRASLNKFVPDYVVAVKSYITDDNILNKNKSTLTKTAIEKWFTDSDTKSEIDIRMFYQELFPDIHTDSDISSYISKFKEKLDNITERLDDRFCYISDLISERLANRLILMIVSNDERMDEIKNEKETEKKNEKEREE